MKKRRVATWLLFVAAFVFACAGGFRAYRVLEPSVLWHSVNATPRSARVGLRHDGEGFLVFYVTTKLASKVAEQPILIEAGSDYHTYSFADAAEEAQKVASASAVQAYVNPADPKQARFLLAYGELLQTRVAGCLGAALLLAGAGLRLRRPVRTNQCGRCAMPVKSFYRFCPHCKSPLQSEAAQSPSGLQRTVPA